jgi:acetyl-CoA/propionyl-CoA carboxylase biotin carboxyl carrier protein
LTKPPFDTILIANRGEIAIRIIRSARELGCRTVAVYSDPDRDARHVRMADEAYHLGAASPALSYLNADKILAIAKQCGAQAVHPGYGFFAENADFARAVLDAGMAWIGPHPAAIEAMGGKIRSRQAMVAAGVPVVPGGTEEIVNARGARLAAEQYGLPLALKASGGGGGKGLKIARSMGEIDSAFANAQREARAYFNNPTIYAERYLDNPKHVELQIVADKHGNVVHVGERDCSLQRRHQKLWEEAPATVSDHVRNGIRSAGITAARAIQYDSVGTIECLVTGDEFFFLEMNTRIQVEHTISEEISGIDLVREQICVAAGLPLSFTQEEVVFRGHAIEVRVNAEDPAHDFQPAPGTIAEYREPGGFGVRVDSAAFPGFVISPDYDSMIAKLIVWGPDRTQALQRLARALDEYQVTGVPTTLSLLRALVDFGPVIEASYGTATLETFASALAPLVSKNGALTEPAPDPVVDTETVRVEVNGKLFRVRFVDLPAAIATRGAGPKSSVKKGGARRSSTPTGNEIRSPMHGVIVEVPVREGDPVAEGEVVIIIEAMKMMNEIRAHKAGLIAAVHAVPGTTVEAQTRLITLA